MVMHWVRQSNLAYEQEEQRKKDLAAKERGRMKEQLTWLRGLLEKAQPGPWRAQSLGKVGNWGPDPDSAAVATDWGKGAHNRMVVRRPPSTYEVVDDEDAIAIAALGTLWPQLLAVATAAQKATACGHKSRYPLRCSEWWEAKTAEDDLNQKVSELQAAIKQMRDSIKSDVE